MEIPRDGSTKIGIVIDDQDIHTSLESGLPPLVTGKPRAVPDEEVNYTERKARDENQWVPIHGITATLPRETSHRPRLSAQTKKEDPAKKLGPPCQTS